MLGAWVLHCSLFLLSHGNTDLLVAWLSKKASFHSQLVSLILVYRVSFWSGRLVLPVSVTKATLPDCSSEEGWSVTQQRHCPAAYYSCALKFNVVILVFRWKSPSLWNLSFFLCPLCITFWVWAWETCFSANLSWSKTMVLPKISHSPWP